MTGEMSASEVTEQNYPALFKLKDMLQKEGIFCDARPFDQYCGPYLSCKFNEKNFEVWYPGPEEVEFSGRSDHWGMLSRKEFVQKPDGTFLVQYYKKGKEKNFEIQDFDVYRIKEEL